MNSIRKLIAMGAGAAAIFAVMAFVVGPAVLAHESERFRGEASAEQSVEPAAAAPSQACLNALRAIAKARKDDRAEDMSEKLAAGQAGADPAKDVLEDQQERAAMKALRVAARTACGDKPKPEETSGAAATPACTAAKQALKNAVAQEKAHELSEKGTTAEHSAADRQEDQAEFATIKALRKATVAACGFSSEHFEHSR